MHVRRLVAIISVLMLVLVLGSVASLAYLPNSYIWGKATPTINDPSGSFNGIVVTLPSVIHGSYVYDANGQNIILTGKTTFYSYITDGEVGKIYIHDANKVYIKDLEVRIAGTYLEQSSYYGLVLIQANYIEGDNIKVDFDGNLFIQLLGPEPSQSSVRLSVLNLQYTNGLQLGGIDVKVHPRKITVLNKLTPDYMVQVKVYPLSLWINDYNKPTYTKASISNINVYVNFPKNIYDRYTTVYSIVGLDLWSPMHYCSKLDPFNNHYKINIDTYRFTAPVITGYRYINIIGLETTGVATHLKYYILSDISITKSSRILVQAGITPIYIASSYPRSPEMLSTTEIFDPGAVIVEYLYISRVKIKSINVGYALYSGGINAYGRIVVGRVSETGIELSAKNIATTGIITPAWLSYLSRAAYSDPMQKTMWYPGLYLTVYKPHLIKPLEYYGGTKGTIENGVVSIKGIAAFIPRDGGVLLFYRHTGTDKLHILVIKKNTLILMRLNLKFAKANYYQLILVKRNAASIAIYDPSGKPSITLRIGGKVMHVSQVAFNIRGFAIARYLVGFKDGSHAVVMSSLPVAMGFMTNRI